MFYRPLDVNVMELTIVFCCEIIYLYGRLPNACDIFPSLLGLSFSFFYALFEGFCQVFAFVSNVHSSMRNLVIWPSYLTYTLFEGFCQVFAFVSNINLVTWPSYLTYTLFEGFCQVFGFVSNLHPSRQNLVT